MMKCVLKFCLFLLLIIVGFIIWFIPFHVGSVGERQVCKFRGQVFYFESHDYSGHGEWEDILFRYHWVGNYKYGRMDFYKRIGGWWEYCGFRDWRATIVI